MFFRNFFKKVFFVLGRLKRGLKLDYIWLYFGQYLVRIEAKKLS